MRLLAVAATTAAVLSLTAACSKDAPTAEDGRLLQRDDLAGVGIAHVASDARVGPSKTNCAAMDKEWNLASSDDSAQVEYRLTSDDLVRSSIQGPYQGSSTIDDTFDRLNTMIDECAAATDLAGTFRRLDGLGNDQIGFESTTPTSSGDQTTQRVYARIDDRTAAAVTVVHTGAGSAELSIAELLPKAIARADEAS